MKTVIKIFFIITLIQNISYAEQINLIKKNGVYRVPVVINDSIKLNFVVDSGAARVSMPYDVFRTLMRTGSITKNDILGKEQYRMANGDIVEGLKVNIRSMKIGNQNISNVLASVDKHMEGMLLLGQSALQKLEPWNMDTKKNVLYIKSANERGNLSSKITDATMDLKTSEKKPIYTCNDKDECNLLAFHFYKGLSGKEQDYSQAIKFYKKSCSYGDAFGCSKVGYMYRNEQGVKYNFSKIMEFYKKACILDRNRCSLVGEQYTDGVDIEKDYLKAKEYFKLACDVGDEYGCEQLKKIEENAP